jgi:hypothetical protein
MVDWPGTPVQPPAPQWPGTPATPNAAVVQRWPGQPAGQAASPASTAQQKSATETGRLYVSPQKPDEEDHGFLAETGRAASGALDTIKAAGNRAGKGPIEGMLQTGKAVAAVPSLLASPLTGAVRSFGGRAIQAGDQLLRKGATKLFGEDKVPAAMTFDEAAGDAEKASMALPGTRPNVAPGSSGALQAARNAAGTIEKIFSPETVDAPAKNAVAIIREASGKAARDTETTAAALEPAYKKVSAMPAQDRLDFLSYVEGRSGRYAGTQMRDPALQDLADTMKTAFEQRMRKIQALPSHNQQAFIDDYFPHFWKDPAKAQQAMQSGGGMSKQGSGASLKARSVPTIADGIAMGLEPVTTNPLEATMRYVTSMDRFIAATDVLETAKNAGTVKYVKPQVMGASGHPNSFKVPPGYTKLEGRGSTNAAGGQAYAPDGFARVYNNWISRGFHDVDEALGDAADGLRRASNSITGLELGLSGYHTLTMAQESMVNSVANAVGYARAGKPVEAAKSLGKAAVAPVGYAIKGKKIQDVYLGLQPGTRHMQEVTDLLTAAGGRAKGASHSPDYEFSKTGSYWTAFKRGALRGQLAADAAEAKGSPLGAAKVGFRHIGRIMDTVAQPIFQAYIPKIKNGAFYENMSVWMKSHPNATREEQVNAARQVWDSVDNRFGELVQDNIFMNKLIKQVGTLSLRSWSWTIGSGRELGGAVRDVARAPIKRPTGIGPNDARWTQKMDYAIALPVVYGTLSAIYQALKTGKPPEGIHDLLAPQTGGVDAATGEPERLIMPGYMKDVFGFYEHPVDEMTNKVATAPQMVKQLATNQDWRGDPIFPPDPDVPQWLTAFWNYATQNVGPISARSIAKGRKEGSNISPMEQVMGVRPAPRYLTDPEGYDQMMKKINEGKWKRKQSYDRKQQRLYEGD